MDWTECAVVETVPGRMGGQPVVKDSRVRPEDLLVNRSEGVAWLAENHGLRVEAVREVLAFYDANRGRMSSKRHTH
jgi:uncharacterized protein (DUF433 family)